MRCVALGCVSLLLLATTAKADWLEASSNHFVIYSEQDERATAFFSERLERFRAAMEAVYGKPQTVPSPSNRVTVFVVSNVSKVREVVGAQNRFLAGMYIPRAGGSVAVIPKLRGGTAHTMSGATVLYHEYAHHFMAGLTSRAFPRWFKEGFAEFVASAQFRDDGSVLLGAPAKHRFMELVYAPDVPIHELLEFDGGASQPKYTYDSFYGQSWVLFHYLQMTPERAGQLDQYQRLLAQGVSALEAAEGAFGDLKKLEKDLDLYMRRRRLSAMVVDASRLSIGPIQVRKLRAGESAMMPVVIESRAGVSPEEAQKLVPEARRIAALYPSDPAVLAALAEAEFDAGNDDAAIAAADRALAIDPKQINAHIQKGFALAHKAEGGARPDESWKEVRAQYIKANAVENDNPIPLVEFYLSYLKEGARPTKNAIAGLEWAMQLAPFDNSVRWLVAQQMIADERYQDAAQTLLPLAYSPHPGEHTVAARRLLDEVKARLQSTEDSSASGG